MKKILLLFLLIGFIFSGCKDYLNMPPKNIKVVYTTQDVKEAMSLFLYATTRTNRGGARISLHSSDGVSYGGGSISYPFSRYVNNCAAIASDDIDLVGFVNENLGNPARGGYTYRSELGELRNWESYLWATQAWKAAYLSVGYLNNVLSDLGEVPDYDKVEHERIEGEARVIRAFYLLKLNQLFAPYDNNDYGIPINFDAKSLNGAKRWKQTDIYKTLIGELMEVLAYETQPKESWNIFFNKNVIYGILAQTYQFKAGSCAAEDDDWKNAEYYAKEARGSSRVENTVEEQKELNYVPSYVSYTVDKPHMFALLRIAHLGDGGNGYSPWGQSIEPQQKVAEELFNMYDANDIRIPVFFSKVGDRYCWVKLQSDYNVDNANESNTLFRIADLLLIEAEAKARRNDPGALSLLNEFKGSKIPGYTGYTGGDVLGEILKERRKEFALEGQMRWLDMKRLGIAVSRQALDDQNALQTYTLDKNDYRYALPIPADKELMYNNIPQNPGWTR